MSKSAIIGEAAITTGPRYAPTQKQIDADYVPRYHLDYVPRTEPAISLHSGRAGLSRGPAKRAPDISQADLRQVYAKRRAQGARDTAAGVSPLRRRMDNIRAHLAAAGPARAEALAEHLGCHVSLVFKALAALRDTSQVVGEIPKGQRYKLYRVVDGGEA